jgi:O-antigen biosynthesis protein
MPNLSVGFISQDWSPSGNFSYPNGCTWYRCFHPAIAISKFGGMSHVGWLSMVGGRVGIKVGPPIYGKSEIYSGYKILVFKLPMHVANIQAVEISKSLGVKVVVDIDDWFDNLPDTNRAKQQTDPEKNKENNRDVYFKIIEMADALICSTMFLYDFYKSKYPNKPIFMIRNSIDMNRWPPRKVGRTLPVIGWVGATPWRSQDLEQLSPFFNEYLESRKNNFHHAGHIPNAPVASELLQIKSKKTTIEPMRPLTQLPEMFKNIDIGIVPLNNIEFNHAKSYLKGLEYVAAGVPFVASWSPEYQLLADAGVGRIATTKNDWFNHLDELQEYVIRDNEADDNRRIVREYFSIESKVAEWFDVFSKIMDL